MQIVIFGAGYVGLSTSVCLADVGNDVVVVDNNTNKVNLLNKGEAPIYEQGLDELLARNLAAGRLKFTTNVDDCLKTANIIIVAVGTPFDEAEKKPDLSQINAVVDVIGKNLVNTTLLIVKSTVPVGTTLLIKEKINSALKNRNFSGDLHIAFNPEFLKEGSAIEDTLKPDRIIIGAESEYSKNVLNELYAPFNRNHNKIIYMDIVSAELTKYAANSMLATKISLMNEFANLADKVGANIEQVRKGIGSDPRIGYHFIYAGCGYGGSCFPKDVQTIVHVGEQFGYECNILKSVDALNKKQKKVIPAKIQHYFNGKVAGKTFALWGLAFKPDTDDIREAPSLTIMEELWSMGAKIKSFDPKAMPAVKEKYSTQPNLVLCDSMYDCLQDADALIICTEWRCFKSPDFAKIKTLLKTSVIFDGRNLYDPNTFISKGIDYIGVGVSAIVL